MNWSSMHFQMLRLRNSINLKHFYILHILGSPFIGFALHLTAHHWPRKNESSKRQIQNTEAQSVRIDCRDFSRFRIFFAITCMNWPNLYIPSRIKTQINPIYFDAFWPVQLYYDLNSNFPPFLFWLFLQNYPSDDDLINSNSFQIKKQVL